MAVFKPRRHISKSMMSTESLQIEDAATTDIEPTESLKENEVVMVGEKSGGFGEVAKVVGFFVIGFWLVSLVGAIIFHMRGGKSTADRLIEKLGKFEIKWEGKSETKWIHRKDIVEAIKRNNASVNRLVIDCINDGKLWQSISGLVSRGAYTITEALPITEAVIEVDKIYKRMDERTFVRDVEDLAKKVTMSANAVVSFLSPLLREMDAVGFDTTYRSLGNRGDSASETLGKVDALHRIFADFVSYTAEEQDVEKISTRGEFDIRVFVDGIKSSIERNDKELANIEKNVEDIKKEHIDRADLKEFIKKSPEFEKAYNELNAQIKYLAVVSKIRAEIVSIVLRVEEYMLGALNNSLSAVYKKQNGNNKSGNTAIGIENIHGGLIVNEGGVPMNHFQACELISSGDRVDEVTRENIRVFGTLLNIGTLVIREAGVQSELSLKDSCIFNDSDVVGLLAARIQTNKKI